jgi:hypothetical protein
MKTALGLLPGDGEEWASAPLGRLPGDEAIAKAATGAAHGSAASASDRLVSFLLVGGAAVLVVEIVLAFDLFG